MRILHVSNFTMKWDGVGFWGIPYKLTNGLIRLGHQVIEFCDRDIADSFFLGIRQLGGPHANAKLIRACRTVRPDMLLLGHCALITPATVAALREAHPGMRIAHWNCDPLFWGRNLARVQALAPLVDISFLTTAGKDLDKVTVNGGRAAFMPNPIDPAIETGRVFADSDVPNDLIYMGSDLPERRAIVARIKEAVPDLKFDLHGLLGHPRVEGAEMLSTLGRARMGLNYSRRNDCYLYSSDRMALFIGNGLLTFTDRAAGFETLFPEDTLALYGSEDELVDKIRYFHAHDDERRRIAERGWRFVHEAFDCTLVARYLVEMTFGETPSQSYAWPTR